MYVVCVTIFVKPNFIRQFITATLDNASNTRDEPGNIRFDVLQGDDDPNRFTLYEVYKDKSDFAAHQTTAHYARWRDVVPEFVEQPRTNTKNHPLFFGDNTVK